MLRPTTIKSSPESWDRYANGRRNVACTCFCLQLPPAAAAQCWPESGPAVGCLVSCFSRRVACLLGSPEKRKTFTCLPLARAMRWGMKGGDGAWKDVRLEIVMHVAFIFLFFFAFSALFPISFMQFTLQTTRYCIVYLHTWQTWVEHKLQQWNWTLDCLKQSHYLWQSVLQVHATLKSSD